METSRELSRTRVGLDKQIGSWISHS